MSEITYDVHLTFRIPLQERKRFYRACKKNGDSNPAERIRHMLRDYTSGKITYEPVQPGE